MKNKNKLIGLILVLSTVMTLRTCGQVSVNVEVIDDNSSSIEDATVEVTFAGYQQDKDTIEKAKTDENGSIDVNGSPLGNAPLSGVHVFIHKEGYYESKLRDLDYTKTKHNLKLVLRKKINPIPLFVKKTSVGMPKENTWFGFDLESGDLVEPEGKGKVADFFVKIKSLPVLSNGNVAPDNGIGELWIKFPNKHEGIIYEKEQYLTTSEMKMPHQAPLNNYQQQLHRKEAAYHNKNFQPNVGAFMRVRVKENEKGEIVSANYVKLNSDIRFDPRESGWHVSDEGKPKTFGSISFTYYFNPTPNDRNLEFDPKHNLFGKLPWNEIIREP